MRHVTVYTADPCRLCHLAKALLEKRGVSFREVNLTKDPDGRAELARRTGLMTFPQIVIDDEPIGGSSALALLDRRGVLLARLSRQRFPVAVVRRRWSPRRVLAFVASSMFGGSRTPWRYVVDLRDRNGRLLERREAASDQHANDVAELLNARATQPPAVRDRS